ncbi:hypothetical protein HYDPIDRAFT_104718 [Hydnomerulius pinastri MD-312]|nr:hypothetical protein HYDPIDRAFT_104718 [Hydnomerulius pinastri MD-312]
MTFTLPSLLYAISRNPVTAVGLPVVFGMLSGSRTRKDVRSNWYKIFPIIWPVLYICMGYASHIAVKAFDEAKTDSARSSLSLALGLYYFQLALNGLWTPLFFGARKVGLALVDSIALLGTNVYMTSILHDLTGGRTSFFLLPYCAWCTYATYLNGGCWFLTNN